MNAKPNNMLTKIEGQVQDDTWEGQKGQELQ